MSDMKIELDDDRTAYTPGEKIAGRVTWHLDSVPDSLELRLLWHTKGKGSRDLSVVEAIAFDQLTTSGERRFDMTLPVAPHSFSGKLISLVWTLEFLTAPTNVAEDVDLVIAPNATEIELGEPS